MASVPFLEALSRSPLVLLLALPLVKALVPLADDNGVPSSHPFPKASSKVCGSKVGALLMDWGWLVAASCASINFFYRYSSSCGNVLQLVFGCVVRLWSTVRSPGPCGCGLRSGPSCSGCLAGIVHDAQAFCLPTVRRPSSKGERIVVLSGGRIGCLLASSTGVGEKVLAIDAGVAC